jgi:hypothetical protein
MENVCRQQTKAYVCLQAKCLTLHCKKGMFSFSSLPSLDVQFGLTDLNYR